MQDAHQTRKIVRSSAVYTVTLVFQKILSFVYFSVLARSLGPETLGAYIFALSFAAFFSLVVDFGFVQMAIRSFAQDERFDTDKFRTFFTIRIGMALLGVALLYACALLLGYSGDLLVLIAVTSVIMVMDAFTAFFWTVFRARQNLVYESIGTAVFQTVIFISGLVVLTKTRDLRALLGIIGVGSLWHIVFSSAMLKLRAGVSFAPRLDWSSIKLWLHRAAPFFLATAFIKAYNTIDSIFIKNMLTDDAVGYYSIAAKVVFTFPFVALAITAAVYPAMSNYAAYSKEKLQLIFTRTLELLLVVSLPIAVGIFLLAEDIILRVWPAFGSSVPALKILIWAVVFLYIEYPFGSLLNATGREKRNTVNRGIQLFVAVSLLIVLLPRYGFMGAVYAALFGSILIVALGWLAARASVSVFTAKTCITSLKIIASSAAMGAFVFWLRDIYSFMVVIPLAALIYLAALFISRAVTKQDIIWVKELFLKE